MSVVSQSQGCPSVEEGQTPGFSHGWSLSVRLRNDSRPRSFGHIFCRAAPPISPKRASSMVNPVWYNRGLEWNLMLLTQWDKVPATDKLFAHLTVLVIWSGNGFCVFKKKLCQKWLVLFVSFSVSKFYDTDNYITWCIFNCITLYNYILVIFKNN